MEALAKQYRKNSYDFKLVERVGDVAIYEQIEPENGRLVCYEVFIVQKQKEGMINGTKLKEKETTPSSAHWGQLGFSCRTLEAAKEKAAMLTEKVNRMRQKLQ